MGRVSATFDVFYRTERAGALRLADGGGPFGFDITVALLVDELIARCALDALVETGCHLGDTTSYLARRYPQLPVRSCDIDPASVAFTRHRLTGRHNAAVTYIDSPQLVAAACERYERPLLYLDAHWGPDWPLARELAAITSGVAVIHDFDIGHPRFGYDTYDGVVCGPQVLAAMAAPPPLYFIPDPDAELPLPCLQTGRRAGVAVVPFGVDTQPLLGMPGLLAHRLPGAVAPVTAGAGSGGGR
jgi:hypothetical protein